MTNTKLNKKFLNEMSYKSFNIILKNIADHYGISPLKAYNEVTGEDAENLIDYMTGVDRDYYGRIMIQFKHNIGT